VRIILSSRRIEKAQITLAKIFPWDTQLKAISPTPRSNFRFLIVDCRLPQKHARYKNGRKNSKDYTAHNIGQIMRPDIDARETNQDRDRQTGDSNPPVREK